jgi:hypothetical protein
VEQGIFSDQCPQELQLPPEQEPQSHPPEAPATLPDSLRALKTDCFRLTFLLPHFSHSMGASFWLMGRIASNSFLHDLQTYS